MTRPLLAVVTVFAAACGHPAHLQYDYSRSFEAAMETQADPGRASVANSAYPLTGFEGLELRQRVTEEATDTETGAAEYTDTFQVK